MLSSEAEYRENVCKCKQCAELIKNTESLDRAFYVYGDSNPVTFRRRGGSIVSLEYPTGDAKKAAAYHYLYNKAKEFEDIRTGDLKHLLENLKITYDDIAPHTGDELVAHLLTWKSSLETASQ
ncbi:hypothetical protein A2V82_14945 [candidate division KSB1 bacterium RBG_16_48_16]|nr:MAG: hypothetical protein A2V82_14945 [candidate division KSB1 bacterium RBG_16_48_16]